MVSPFSDLLFLVSLIGISGALLIAGAVMDYRRRSVNAFLFVPIMIMGVVANIEAESPVIFIALSVLAFAMSYLDPSQPAYIFFSVIFIASGLVMLYMRNLYGFEFLIIAIIHAMGFRQTYFGIGDIKAMIAVIFSFTGINVRLVSGVLSYHGLIANGVSILLDIVIASAVFLALSWIFLKHSGIAEGGLSFRIPFSEEMQKKLGKKFGVKKGGGKKYLAYRVPFLIPVTMGFFLFVLIGSWAY